MFPNNEIGTITVRVKRIEKFIEMRISDNGVGLPADFSLASTNTLGITLLKGLTAQLKGTYAVESHNGLTITLKFPIEVNVVEAKLLNT